MKKIIQQKLTKVNSTATKSKVKKKVNKITKNMTFAEVMQKDHNAAMKLAQRGMFCGGCPMAMMETIEQGAMAHGLDADEITKELNKKSKRN